VKKRIVTAVLISVLSLLSGFLLTGCDYSVYSFAGLSFDSVATVSGKEATVQQGSSSTEINVGAARTGHLFRVYSFNSAEDRDIAFALYSEYIIWQGFIRRSVPVYNRARDIYLQYEMTEGGRIVEFGLEKHRENMLRLFFIATQNS